MTIEIYLAERGYTGETLDKYRRALEHLVKEIQDLENLDALKLRSWLDAHDWGSSAKWVAWCTVKGFLSWKYGADHPALRLKVRRTEAGPQRSLNMGQVKIILASFDTMTAKGIRDLAICSLMLDSGLRSSEICRLDLKNLNLTERHLAVIIKGGKWGEGVFSQLTASYLDHWLAIRNELAKPGTHTVFIGLGGDTRGMPLTREGFTCIVRAWGVHAGIGALSPHDLRRTFAVLATRLHAPARVLQVAGRWSNIAMVERYTQAIVADDFEEYFPVTGAMS